jgi:matrixin
LKTVVLGIIIAVLISVSYNNAFATPEKIKITAPWNSGYGSIKVTIINDAGLAEDKISVVKSAINSETNYSFAGHTYFVGWAGALRLIDHTRNTEFKILESDNKENANADITIRLLNSADQTYSGFESSGFAYGGLKYSGLAYSGVTKPILVENKIKQASIRIFNSNDITPMQLENLVRHEFGHALGLGHSTDQNSIMYGLIESEPKLITDCDLSGLQGLTAGRVFTEVECNHA